MSQLPIVLAHGYLGFGTLGPFEYFKDVQETLVSLGAESLCHFGSTQRQFGRTFRVASRADPRERPQWKSASHCA